MIFQSHHFKYKENKIDIYWYEDRYRYVVNKENIIEYREFGPSYLLETIPSLEVLQSFIISDMHHFIYNEQQLSAKCIRCSKWHGSPRKDFNLAPICNRCFGAMTDTINAGNTEYEIKPDGSKGNVIK